jgi:hypothetical protein
MAIGTTVGPIRGMLNRDLLQFLLEQPRPVGERIDVVLIDFLDQFRTTGELGQWTLGKLTAGDPSVTVAATTGYASVASDSFMVSGVVGDFMDDWKDQTTAWDVTAVGASDVIEGYFYAQDETLDDAYFWQIDYGAKTLELYRRVAAADTQIGSTISLAAFLVNLKRDVVRVDALAEGSSTRIRVRVDGELYLDALDAQWSKGRIGFGSTSGTGRLHYVEVNTIPTTILRVGPR